MRYAFIRQQKAEYNEYPVQLLCQLMQVGTSAYYASWQYPSDQYLQLLKQHGMTGSMSRKGNCWDNSPTERFFRTLKSDWGEGRRYQDLAHAREDIARFMHYYNLQRPHSVLGYLSPVEYERAMKAKCA